MENNSLEPIRKDLATVPKKEEPKEDYIDAKVTEETVEKKQETIVTKEQTKSSSHSATIGAIIAAIILLLIVFIAWNGYKHVNPEAGYSTQTEQEAIHEHQNPELKADKFDNQKVYILSGAKDELNHLSVSVDKIQFRKDVTRVWVTFKNEGGQTIHMMPNANSVLVDNKGNQYKVDAFAGDQITEIASGVKKTAMLVFEPIRSEAKELTYHLDSVFDMKNPAWNVAITVDIP